MRTLIRVEYGHGGTPVEDREYREDGRGPVGTIAEFKEVYPNDTFEIIDHINPEDDIGEKN